MVTQEVSLSMKSQLFYRSVPYYIVVIGSIFHLAAQRILLTTKETQTYFEQILIKSL
jgi:hypothetical protein